MSDELIPLIVRHLDRRVEDAVTITLQVPDAHRDDLRYRPGQYVMVRHPDDDEFRSYSICQAPPADGSAPTSVRIAVRLLGSGGFGEHAHAVLREGDTVEVLRPTGRFRLQPTTRHVAVAAGSGITPVLAMAEAALLRGDEFALVYGNRTAASTMFADELAQLQVRFADRFQVRHVLSREDRHSVRRIGADTLPQLLDEVGAGTTDGDLHFYVCGPTDLITTVRTFLTAAGVERRHVHSELFAVSLPALR